MSEDARAEARRPAGHPAVPHERLGVLLINLGTPDDTGYHAMRRYLREFLSDRRVVELSPWLWQPILQGVILTTRPTRSGRNYAKIWNRERDESPLRTITRAQAEALAGRFGAAEAVVVDWAMRYGRPSIAERLDALLAAGCRRVLLAPLYPQYSAATSATACDQAFRHLMTLRWQPAVRTLPPYHDDPAYIGALADSVRSGLARLDWEPEVLLASFHGLPKENLAKGDPYHCHCQKTARLLREALGWPEERLRIVFQSRFGPKEWLQPYADVTTAELARQGTKRLAVISPGFVADCVETLEELNIGLRETFLEGGGEHFAYLPCLNDTPGSIDLLEGLTRRELAGWLPAATEEQDGR
ncbi:ferrochelatase [Tistlia consotensis]|uniref:Ferrochelatase n=1 Tax=Tistlia consotensis USBA 355 TaxID=560819 RepID=A0A1Y6BG40_9PROT|nr:ferrochelatase [Tistlia consotensis]SMF08984.1 ferrochelatase [Tistlia consotensis USBA 355]SNR34950.1 ferrochelatase [Tistlia consotensis]